MTASDSPSVVTTGELLVEIMRPETGVPLDDVGTFVGPFPSGAPGIFIDGVARLDHSAGIIGAVGADAFGHCIRERLERDGVDISAVNTVTDRSTGVAFVTYFADGSREFLYHLGTAAAGAIGPADVPESVVADAAAVHVNGSSLLATAEMRAACERMVDIAAANDCLVSFDLNIRPELLGDDLIQRSVATVLEQTDLLLVTADELALVTDCDAVDSGVTSLLERGISLVAVTKGSDGCSLSTAETTVHHEGFDVDVVDPTGAGDAFAAAAVVATLEEYPLEQRAAFANAAGACAVTEQGPMEGLATRSELEALLE